MEQQFLRIKQATERYFVSDMTLRRLAREVTREPGHEFREYVRPTAEDLKRLHAEDKPFEYELSTKLLGLRYKERHLGPEEGSDRVSETRAHVGSAAMAILESTNDLLRQQLTVKDEQIRQLNESLRAMQQQQNATNMLLVRLSERIPLLVEGTAKRAAPATESPAGEGATAKPETPKKAAKAEPRKTEKRGVWGRWFRREPAKAGAGK